MRFRVKMGVHVGDAGQRYTKGQVVETDNDLVSMFPNKFDRIGEAEDQFDGLSLSPIHPFGNEVTEIVDHRLHGSDLKVFHKAGIYTVTDKHDEQLNDKPLTREDLTVFLNEYFNVND